MAAVAILKNLFKKSPYLGRGLTDFDEIWHNDAAWPSWAFWPLKFRKFKISRWRRPSWKTDNKIATSRQRFDWFLRSLAWRRSSTLLKPSTDENLKFWKSKMALASNMEIRKITIFWPEFDRFRRNLARRRSFAILNVASIKISKKLKIQDGGNRRLEKSKKSLYLGTARPISTKFGAATQFTLLSRPTLKNLKYWKSKMAAVAVFKIEKS